VLHSELVHSDQTQAFLPLKWQMADIIIPTTTITITTTTATITTTTTTSTTTFA
jgi:hypothetical protein